MKETKLNFESKRCPLCKYILYKRYLGYVCKNWKCELYHKLDQGWIKIEKDFYLEKFDLTYLFSLDNLKNKGEWNLLKKQIYERDNYVCQICFKNLRLLNEKFNVHAHHIIPRSEAPELTYDEENIITLCEDCHKKIHNKDKYSFRKKDSEQ